MLNPVCCLALFTAVARKPVQTLPAYLELLDLEPHAVDAHVPSKLALFLGE